jgi:predicted GIY-YIG superfamily endonuclease
MHGIGKRFVYVVRSQRHPERYYVGLTSNVDERLEWHNHGPCGHTLEHRPWALDDRTDSSVIT